MRKAEKIIGILALIVLNLIFLVAILRVWIAPNEEVGKQMDLTCTIAGMMWILTFGALFLYFVAKRT